MFLKFFAPATEKPRGLLFRLSSGAIISLLALVLLTTTFALKTVHYYAVDPVVSPRQLYHNTWKALRDNLYDQSKLKNWDEWEHKYDHLIKTEEDALRYSHILVQSVGEGYTALLPAETVARDKVSADGQYVGIGIELDHPDGLTTPVIARVLRGGPAEKAGIEKGDVLVAVDGVQSASRSLADIHQSLQGKAGEQVVLTLRRQGTNHTITVTRDVVQTPIVYYEKLPGGIGYLRIMAFHQWSTAKQVEEAMKALSDCDALIIDLRDNPGGFIHEAVKAASLFIEEGTIATTVQRVPSVGLLTSEIHLSKSRLTINNSVGPISGVPVPLFWRPPYLANHRPVILLINGNSASAAETFAAALVENGVAIAIGGKTFGKGIGQIYVPIGNGHRIRITHLKSFTPQSNWLGDAGQSVADGVRPQIEVADSPPNKRDRQLERAIERAKELIP